jgi:peptidoglycan hydrolase CwlO-like protein
MFNLQERRQQLATLIQQKSAQYTQIDNARLQLNNEILKIEGQINLLDEMIKEEKLKSTELKEPELPKV